MFYYTSVLFIPAHKCLFSISFLPHAPSLSHPTSPLFPSSLHPKGKLFADLLDWFLWLPSNLQTCSRRPNTLTLLLIQTRLLRTASKELSRKDKRVTVRGKCVCVCVSVRGWGGNKKRQMKRGSELQGCAFLWLSGSGVHKKK